ncbi:hypothetical protein MRB53_025802 [Persea americana]|uniref:Uncharacterized protein n=1 Tax=Persea americana TaxID=3435 RepID=A0ACC2LGX6_PERAE|nr:hypothetical protein MRB53_025802 [Persea americana]
MGFPQISYAIFLPKPIEDLLDIWAHVKHILRLALFYLGLFNPTDFSPSWEDHSGRASAGVHSYESSSPITPELVKKSLPVVDFTDDDDVESICAVCFSRLQMGHEIRELWNCSHVFHVGCLDKWVDQGHMTCPVCKSTLLAEEGGEKEGRKGSWMVEIIAYLLGPATRGGAAVRGSGDSISSSPATVRPAATCDNFLLFSFSSEKQIQPSPPISNISETSPFVSGDKSLDPLFLAATQQRDIIVPRFPATRRGTGDCVSVNVVSK